MKISTRSRINESKIREKRLKSIRSIRLMRQILILLNDLWIKYYETAGWMSCSTLYLCSLTRIKCNSRSILKWSTAGFYSPRLVALPMLMSPVYPVWVECLSIARETRFQFQVESYQRLKKWYLTLPCLTLSVIRYGLRIKWSNPGKRVAPFLTP